MKKQLSIFPQFFTVFLDLLGIGIIIPILAPLLLNPNETLLDAATSMDTRAIILGFLIASYPLAQFFGAPVLGALADQRGRKRVLLIALTGTLLGYLLFAYGIVTHQLWILFASRILDGFTGGNIAIVQSSIADVSTEKTRSRNFGLVGMAFGLGFILGPYIGGKLADPTIVSWFNSATPFFFAALMTALNMVLVVFRFPETHTVAGAARVSILTGVKNLKKAFTTPNLRVLFIVVFLITIGFSFFTQFFSVYLINKFQFTQSDIGDYFAWIGLCVAIVQGALIRPVSAKFNPETILSVSLIGLSAALALQLLPTEAIWLYAITPLIALTNGFSMPSYTSLISTSVSPKEQGEILGINQSIQSLGQAIPPILAGFLITVNQYLPIITASVVMFIAWFVFMAFYKGRHPRVQQHEVA